LLSSALIVFVAASIIHRQILSQLRDFVLSPLLWSMGLLFFLPLLSGLWSADLDQWARILRIKLPLFLLPICFAGNQNVNAKNWRTIAFSFLALVFAGICQSLWKYFQNLSLVHADYLRAHTIETPAGNDHVRFSLLVAIAVLTSVFLLIRNRKIYNKITLAFLVISSLIFIAYLHVLAVRTGLLCFYLGSFVLIAYLAWRRENKKYLLMLPIFLVLPIVAYYISPTFKNRMLYLKYDLSLVRNNVYLHGSNDGNRIASIRGGWQLLLRNPFTGVGFGDVTKQMDDFYQRKYPQMNDIDKILPSSEWMIYGAGNGWPGFILFTLVMVIPFFVSGLRKNIVWIILNCFIVISYLFDIGLEVQYGVFIHAFILLWWYKWLREEYSI
jgi:hypothetical protein